LPNPTIPTRSGAGDGGDGDGEGAGGSPPWHGTACCGCWRWSCWAGEASGFAAEEAAGRPDRAERREGAEVGGVAAQQAGGAGRPGPGGGGGGGGDAGGAGEMAEGGGHRPSATGRPGASERVVGLVGTW